MKNASNESIMNFLFSISLFLRGYTINILVGSFLCDTGMVPILLKAPLLQAGAPSSMMSFVLSLMCYSDALFADLGL